MAKWNNLKHIKRNFLLLIANVVIIIFGFLYIPVSTLVMLAMLPAVIYAIWSKQWALVALTCVIFGVFLLVFFACLFQPAAVVQLGENINFIFHLYLAIYPYEINISIAHLLGFQLMFWLTIFLFFVLLVSVLVNYSEFTLMVAFSTIVMMFSVIYFLLNIFSFLIPQLQYYMANNFIFQFVFVFFFVILPFLTLVFMILYVELYLIDVFKRQDYKQEAIKIKRSQKLTSILKWLGIGFIILFAIIIIGGGVLV